MGEFSRIRVERVPHMDAVRVDAEVNMRASQLVSPHALRDYRGGDGLAHVAHKIKGELVQRLTADLERELAQAFTVPPAYAYPQHPFAPPAGVDELRREFGLTPRPPAEKRQEACADVLDGGALDERWAEEGREPRPATPLEQLDRAIRETIEAGR